MNYDKAKLPLNAVRQIGKGTFSNVYLCRKNDVPVLMDSDYVLDEYWIVKEININTLVERYMKNNRNKEKPCQQRRQNNSEVNVNITPYQTGHFSGDHTIRTAEEEYYYRRLQQLVDSEIDVLKMLKHASIIKFFDHAVDAGVYSLRMEYCDLGDVYNYLKRAKNCSRNLCGGMSDHFLHEFIYQTACGLMCMHERNLIHRDVKLQNILMKRENGRVVFKLSDFGFSCFDLSDRCATRKLTELDFVLCKKYYKLCGTPYYMAPEIVLNMDKLENFTNYSSTSSCPELAFYNKSIDVWSYGMCLYELTFNCLPFDNVNNIKELEALFAGSSFQSTLETNVNAKQHRSPTVQHILQVALQVQSAKRASFRDILSILEEGEKMEEACRLSNTSEMTASNSLGMNSMGEHILKTPIDSERGIENEKDSWEQVNNSSSLMMHMSIPKGFLNWLFNKKD